ncbi:MAG: hypothetical protein ABIM99_02125 [Candidatus Dojkabacteria bacterium]
MNSWPQSTQYINGFIDSLPEDLDNIRTSKELLKSLFTGLFNPFFQQSYNNNVYGDATFNNFILDWFRHNQDIMMEYVKTFPVPVMQERWQVGLITLLMNHNLITFTSIPGEAIDPTPITMGTHVVILPPVEGFKVFPPVMDQATYSKFPGIDFETLTYSIVRYKKALDDATIACADGGYDNRPQQAQDTDAVVRTRLVFQQFPDIFPQIRESSDIHETRGFYQEAIWDLAYKAYNQKGLVNYLIRIGFNNIIKFPGNSIKFTPKSTGSEILKVVLPRSIIDIFDNLHNRTVHIRVYGQNGVQKDLYLRADSSNGEYLVGNYELSEKLSNALAFTLDMNIGNLSEIAEI